MNEICKGVARFLLFPFAFFGDGNFQARAGTWQFRFLLWVYGEDNVTYAECLDNYILDAATEIASKYFGNSASFVDARADIQEIINKHILS